MSDDHGPGASPGAGKPLGERDEDAHEAALARRYRQAAQGDAYHQRASGPAPGTEGPALTTTPEVPDVPLPDVAKPDKADGEAKGVTTGDARKDAILRGLEPGETGGVD